MFSKICYIFYSVTAFLLLASCTKEYSDEGMYVATPVFPACEPVPSLSGRAWNIDTIVIDPPATYNTLSTQDQEWYSGALAWNKHGTLTFNNDCTYTQSFWGTGYGKWALSDNKKDIKIRLNNGKTDSLLNYKADMALLSYQKNFGNFSVTYFLK